MWQILVRITGQRHRIHWKTNQIYQKIYNGFTHLQQLGRTWIDARMGFRFVAWSNQSTVQLFVAFQAWSLALERRKGRQVWKVRQNRFLWYSWVSVPHQFSKCIYSFLVSFSLSCAPAFVRTHFLASQNSPTSSERSRSTTIIPTFFKCLLTNE